MTEQAPSVPDATGDDIDEAERARIEQERKLFNRNTVIRCLDCGHVESIESQETE
jgi:hypothetical protein